jgi:hypothetical protein
MARGRPWGRPPPHNFKNPYTFHFCSKDVEDKFPLHVLSSNIISNFPSALFILFIDEKTPACRLSTHFLSPSEKIQASNFLFMCFQCIKKYVTVAKGMDMQS